jgi:hypothetical protein
MTDMMCACCHEWVEIPYELLPAGVAPIGYVCDACELSYGDAPREGADPEPRETSA